MRSAKEILVKPIASGVASEFIRTHHYSGKAVRNSQLHFGVYLDNRLEGVMQFGPSLDKNKTIGLVAGTPWNGFFELNRMAFTDYLPRNSESRALSVALRIIRKNYPQIKWVISFADACQCGDGTIYRASGFVLTAVKTNKDLIRLPDGSVTHKLSVVTGSGKMEHFAKSKGKMSATGVGDVLEGFQIRYLYFFEPEWRKKLTVPELPFSEIAKRGAKMYLGKSRGESIASDAPGLQPGEGGANPTSPLQSNGKYLPKK